MPLSIPKFRPLGAGTNAVHQAVNHPPSGEGPPQSKKERIEDLKKRFRDVEFRGAGKILVGDDVKIAPGVRLSATFGSKLEVKGRSRILPGTRLKNCDIEDSRVRGTVSQRWFFLQRPRISHSILATGATVRGGAEITRSTLRDNAKVLGPHTVRDSTLGEGACVTGLRKNTIDAGSVLGPNAKVRARRDKLEGTTLKTNVKLAGHTTTLQNLEIDTNGVFKGAHLTITTRPAEGTQASLNTPSVGGDGEIASDCCLGPSGRAVLSADYPCRESSAAADEDAAPADSGQQTPRSQP